MIKEAFNDYLLYPVFLSALFYLQKMFPSEEYLWQ